MRPIAALALLAIMAFAPPARAWTEARPAGLITETAIDRDGGATVTLRVRWRVLAGHFRTFDIAELPADFTLLEASATDVSGNAVAVSTRVRAPGRLEISLGEEGGLRRGTLDVVIRYTTSLRAQGAIRRHGSDAVIEVTTVPWERGLEATEMRVSLPASVRRAQWLADDTPGVDATVTSELGRDVLHAIRRHLPAGTRWTGRIVCDPTLFPWLDGPRALRPASPRTEQRTLTPVIGLASILAATLGFVVTALRRTRRHEPLVSLPVGLRALPETLAALGGAIQGLVWVPVSGALTIGTLVALAGCIMLVPRPLPLAPIDPALPWRRWSETRVLTAAKGCCQRPWKTIAALGTSFLGVALAVTAMGTQNLGLGITGIDLSLVAMAAAVSMRRLAPCSDVHVLRSVARSMARLLGERARVAWQVRGDGSAPGSVRLQVIPRVGYQFVDGLSGIECALAWRAGTLSWHATPVLMVRAACHSPLEHRLQQIAHHLGRIEISHEGNRLALVVDLVGPDRYRAFREIERLLPHVVVPVRIPAVPLCTDLELSAYKEAAA